jgi:nitric oxide reductase subunit C
MLSKSAAKAFFLVGTAVCGGAFILLTIDTISRVPKQTNQQNMTESVIRGKHIWEDNNCMGCHTLLGEGAYYAPELTKVYERRGAAFIDAMLIDPAKMYPGKRKMVKYNFTAQERGDMVAFLKWIGEMDLNGFPAKPNLGSVASSNSEQSISVAKRTDRPQIFNQMCVACHTLEGQGGTVGPTLDGIGDRRDIEFLRKWLSDPLSIKPDSKMPKLPLTEADITELSAFLSQIKTRGHKESLTIFSQYACFYLAFKLSMDLSWDLRTWGTMFYMNGSRLTQLARHIPIS